jgi:valyl-tRNA synthetase
LADSWVWARLQQLVRDVERLFQTHQYGEAGRQIYDFFWSEFADWYVEAAKQQMQTETQRGQTVKTLARVLDISLRLLHPFTPFITEELWGHLRTSLRESPLAGLAADWPEALIVAGWPTARPTEGWEDEKAADFALVQEIVRSIRNVRAEKNVSPARRLAARIGAGGKSGMLKDQAHLIAALAGLDGAQFTIAESLKKDDAESVALVVGPVEIRLPLAGMVDVKAERERIAKELADNKAQITRLEQLLSGEFAQKAPAAVVAKERERLAALKETAEKLGAQLGHK